MEPIDNIIKNKLRESNDLHRHEMELAKPFVWSAVRQNLEKRRTLTWGHLAAAVVFLGLCFSFVLYYVQQRHQMEMGQLSERIEQLQSNYLMQNELLESKNTQVKSLREDLRKVVDQRSDQPDKKSPAQRKTTVHLVDTVYIKQVEYITLIPEAEKEITASAPEESSRPLKTAAPVKREIDDVIFPSYPKQPENNQNEAIQVRFGSFVATRK